MTYSAEVLADSPLAYYRMADTTGTSMVDSSGNSRNGTYTGTPTKNVTGLLTNDANKSVDFPANGSYASVASASWMNVTTAMTAEVWFQVDSIVGYRPIIARTSYVSSPSDTATRSWDLLVWNDGKLGFEITASDGTNISTAITGTTISTGVTYHAVLTFNGTSVKVYLNGTEVYTSNALSGKSVNAPASTNLYLGTEKHFQGAVGERFDGRIDEAAYYNTALSASRVLAHYEAGVNIVHGGYTAQAMTASVAVPGGVKQNIIDVAATPLTASVLMPDAIGYGTKSVVESRSYGWDGVAPDNGALSSGAVLYDFELPADLNNTNLMSAVLRVRRALGTSSLTVEQITQEWTSGVFYSGTTGGSLSTGTTATGQYIDIDVTSLLDATNFYGFRISGSGTMDVSNANPASLILGYVSTSIPANASGQPFTADAVVVDPTVGEGKDVAADPMTASAMMPEPIVLGERHVDYTAEDMEAQATLVAGAFSSPATFDAVPLTADAEVVDPTVETTTGVLYYADGMTATATLVKPALVNDAVIIIGESEDKYFNRVFNLAPKVWQRLNDLGGTAVDRMATYNGTYHGVLVGQYGGPDGRHSVTFSSGDYIEQTEPTGANADEAQIQNASAAATTLEFSFKTDKANTFLMAGADSTQTSAGVKSSYAAREVFLKDGRLTFRSRIFAGTPDQVDSEFTGPRVLNDGQWHHVVVKSGVYSRGQWATELWVDGTFEIRRFATNGFMGFPDYIGWRPDYIDGSELETLPSSQYFVGDMTEVAFYNHNNLASHDIARNYYALMGWSPIIPEPLEASATMVDADGGGNQKKALYLYWNRDDEVFQTGDPAEWSLSFDPMPGFVSLSGTNVPNPLEPVGDYFGYKVFAKGIRLNTGFTSYRDPITDDESLINLEHDIDLDDYDVIMFKDWPDEGDELDDIEYNYPGQKERLLQQLRDANDNGIGLYVTNPRLAVDLGVIDRVEFVPHLRESATVSAQGNALGLYDYASAVEFPWNISASDGLAGGDLATGIGEAQDLTQSALDNKAYYYYDTHANNRFRVVASVEGLTDLPAYMIDEAVWHVDYDQYGWQGAAYKYLKRESGLLIGDEYIFHGSALIDPRFLNLVDRRYNRFNGTWATPAGHVKAGTIVTTFGSKHTVGKVEVDNPYKDYATTIVLEPGDFLAGRPVGGRIFVNFTEQTSNGLAVVTQNIPSGSTGWPQGYPVETAAQREWDYSWTRTTLSTTQQQVAVSVTVVMPDGSQKTLLLGGAGADLAMVRSGQLFSLTGNARLEMTGRGMYWLAAAEEVDPDAVVVRAQPMTATATVPNAVATAQRDNTIHAQPMSAVVNMPRVAEDESGDNVVLALPFTADASFTGFGKTITATPMTASAELVENFEFVRVTGEQVVLTLHGEDATLYLKEES